MKELKIKVNTNLRTADGTPLPLKKHKHYIVPDSFIESIMESQPRWAEMLTVKDFVNEKELQGEVDFTGKKLLLSRTGGFGDFFFILRSVRHIKEHFEDVNVTVAAGARFLPAVSTFFPDIVDRSMQLPIPKEEYDRCDYFITFESYIEQNFEATKVNAFDLMACKFFIKIEQDHSLPIYIPPGYKKEAKALQKSWPEGPIIGIQPKASAVLRTYPYHYTAMLIRQLQKDGYQVLLLDRKQNIDTILADPDMQGISVLTPYDAEKKIRGSIQLSVALVELCELIIAPDSVMVYVADSLQVPVIGIYGPFSSELRTSKLNVHAVEVVGGCYNCCEHSSFPCKMARQGRWSPCLKKIKPELLYQIIKSVLAKDIEGRAESIDTTNLEGEEEHVRK